MCHFYLKLNNLNELCKTVFRMLSFDLNYS